MPDAPPLLADRYRLGDRLGRGGMGEVRLARDEVLQRDVAIKAIDQLGGEDDAIARRTLREARAAARLSHPSVVQVYDVLQVDGRTWIVMEYVPSRSLRQVLADDGPLGVERAARIGLDLLGALRAAHRAGVQHRDVKPANVLLADDGRVLLTDFGIAAVDDDGVISRSDVVVGSPQFMAPERARTGVAGPEGDLWSLGATLYAAVEGHAPFERSSTMATLMALTTEDVPPPVKAGALGPVLDGLLRKDPADRLGLEDAEAQIQAVASGGAAKSRIPRQRKAAEAPAPGETSRTLGRLLGRRSGGSPSDGAGGSPSDGAGGSLPDGAGGSPSDGAAGSAGDGSGPGRRRGIVAGAALLVVLVVAGVIGLVNSRNEDEPDARRPDPVSTSAAPAGAPGSQAASSPASQPGSPAASQAAPSTDPVASPDGRPQLPAGWKDYTDPTGFSVYVPSDWERSKRGSIVYFRGDGRVLGIDQTDQPKSDPVADWRGQADYRVSRGDFPGYREIKIESVDFFRKAADWEFTFTRGGTRQHVNNRGAVISDKKAYGFYWQTADSEWSAARPDLQLVFDSFRPAG